MTKQRFTVADAANLLETTPDAVRMRIQRGKLESVKEGNRVYILLDSDETKYKRESELESSALVSAKDETIALLKA